MFGKKAKKKHEEDLRQQNQQTSQMLMQALNKPPSALEAGKEKEQTDWLNETNSPDFDITKTKGMSPYLDLFNRAKANDLSDETPLPAAASWGGTPNASLSEALKAQGARSREQEAAGGLERGFAAKNASIRGETLPFMGLQQNKNLALWDVLNNRSLNLSGQYGKSISQPGFLQQFLLQGLSSGGQAAAAYLGKPG